MILGVSFAAGAVNAVAGGATNFTFPTLLWLGVPPVQAVATNSVGLWPGALGAAWGFRAEIAGIRGRWLWLVAPAVLGGAAGAWLLVHTPSAFLEELAPWLVLVSTALIAVEPWLRRRAAQGGELRPGSGAGLSVAVLADLALGVYAGYYGAGMGILLLMLVGLLGVTDIHQANGLKNVLSVASKGASILYIAAAGVALWGVALLMAVASILGGYAGARIGRRVEERRMRAFVVASGLVIAILLF